MRLDGVLVLADGSVFEGELFGAPARLPRPARSCSTRALSGYQEILTDPSYAGQIITFTNPHIGNYGVNADRLRGRAACSAGASSSASCPAGRATAGRRATSTRCSSATASRASPASTPAA